MNAMNLDAMTITELDRALVKLKACGARNAARRVRRRLREVRAAIGHGRITMSRQCGEKPYTVIPDAEAGRWPNGARR